MTPEMTGQPPIGPEEGPEQMFARSAESCEAERELTARVGALCDEFLRRAAMSSAVEFRSLVENFTQTELPETPAEVGAYLDELAESVINHAVNTSAPRFVGHMTSALPYFVRPLSMLVTALNQNQVKVETSKAFTLDTGYGAGVPIVALRAVIANPLTTERDLEAVLDDQLRVAAELHLVP